jgi:branched-chain amino acid transport system ATP-binding protein
MDTDITGLVPHELYAAGLLRTFQIAREFSKLTVLENLLVAADSQLGESIINTWLARGRVRMQEKKLRKQAAEVMDFLRLSHLAHTPAGQLSGGQKKLVELGRTMMTTPKIVLLDEVGAGVNKTLLGEIADAIARLNRERGYTFFMIEHDLDFLERLCSSVIVMADGAVLTQGTINEIKNNEAVIESYLGRQG